MDTSNIESKSADSEMNVQTTDINSLTDITDKASEPVDPEDTEIQVVPENIAESQSADTVSETLAKNEILIAYFSRSGNTRALATEIEKQTSGTLFEIIPIEAYPEDYGETVERWHRERDADERPEITSVVENMESYGVIFVGYPIWSNDVPAVVRTFLEQYDMTGKMVIPFCTHGGSGFGVSLDRLEELCPGAVIGDGFEIYGTSVVSCEAKVAEWLSGIDFIQ
jgi:flavodoxin